jgi:transglutaminase-like putative cysteine protease
VKLPRLRLPASPVENSLEARAFVFSGFAVAVLAIVLYGQDYVIPALGLATTAIGHVVSYRGRARKRRLAGQVVLAALVFGALAYFLADSVLAIFGGILPQANFAIALVAVTSFDLKTRRNCYSSLWISLAILYLAAVYAWDYPFGLLVALWAVCLGGFWMASHLRRMEARLSAPPAALAVVVLGALAIGLAGFIVLPQPAAGAPTPLVVSLPNFVSFRGEMENPALPLVQIAGDPAGATNSVDLHFRGRLGDTPVMYVRTGAPAYWRGLVFDTYRDGQWTASNRGYVELQPYVPPRLLPPAPPNNLGTFVQTFRVLRPLPGVISAAYPIQSLYVPVAALRQDAYGTFRTPSGLRPGQTYSAVSYLPNLTAQELEKAPFAGPMGGEYLDYSVLSQQARSLARQAVEGHTETQFDTVMALTNYLQANFQYSQQLGHVPPGRDPVDWFLFDVKIGYCEQFATAETLMLRSLGIPARLATGYSTGDYDPVLDQSIVRERDAHAWVEVWFPDHGWVPVDPSPGFSPLAATQFPSHWAAGGLARLLPHLEIGAPLAAIGSLGLLAVIPPAVAIALMVVIAWAWLRTRRSPRRARAGRTSKQESELLRLYERVQRRLGRRRAPPETPLEYMNVSSPGEMDSLLEELTSAVNEGAYAGRWPELTRVRELADRLS